MSAKNHDPQKIRESILFHLGAANEYGMQHSMQDLNIDFIEAQEQGESFRAEKRVSEDDKIQDGAKSHVEYTDYNSKVTDIFSLPVEEEDLEQVETMQDLEELLGPCERCKLNGGRKHIVFGVGDIHADLMFIGEGPGADEDEQGVPFVGKAGQLLTKMIEAMGLSRDSVYIANVVKCRPENNRNPEPDEIESCMPFLQKQIELVDPKVIICLGKFAAQTILETQIPISRLRGKFRELKNGIKVMPTFHPAYLLRNAEMKRPAWEDLKMVIQELGLKK